MPSDATAVLTGLVSATDDDVLDFFRIKRALLDDLGNDRSQHVVRPHTGERAGVAAKWGAQSGVDIPVEHYRFLLAIISSCPRAAVKSSVQPCTGPWGRSRMPLRRLRYGSSTGSVTCAPGD